MLFQFTAKVKGVPAVIYNYLHILNIYKNY